MNCKTSRRINGYCQSIDFIKQILDDNEIIFEEKPGEIIITSPLTAGTQYNIEGLFYCANVPLDEFEYGVQNYIQYYELDINQIKKEEVCGKTREIELINLGNGMLYQIESITDAIFLVLNHDYATDTITIKDVSGIVKEECIICDDVSLVKSVKQGEDTTVSSLSILNQKIIFCGYIRPEYYTQYVNKMKNKDNYCCVHDFEKFEEQMEKLTLI